MERGWKPNLAATKSVWFAKKVHLLSKAFSVDLPGPVLSISIYLPRCLPPDLPLLSSPSSLLRKLSPFPFSPSLSLPPSQLSLPPLHLSLIHSPSSQSTSVLKGGTESKNDPQVEFFKKHFLLWRSGVFELQSYVKETIFLCVGSS